MRQFASVGVEGDAAAGTAEPSSDGTSTRLLELDDDNAGRNAALTAASVGPAGLSEHELDANALEVAKTSSLEKSSSTRHVLGGVGGQVAVKSANFVAAISGRLRKSWRCFNLRKYACLQPCETYGLFCTDDVRYLAVIDLFHRYTLAFPDPAMERRFCAQYLQSDVHYKTGRWFFYLLSAFYFVYFVVVSANWKH